MLPQIPEDPPKQSAQPAFSTVGCHCWFCACNCHTFAKSLKANFGFFKYQELHLPVPLAPLKCTQAEKLEIFRPARDISYKFSGHSCLNNSCKYKDCISTLSPNLTVHYRKINEYLWAQHKGYSICPQTVTQWTAKPETSKLWPSVIRSLLVTTGKLLLLLWPWTPQAAFHCCRVLEGYLHYTLLLLFTPGFNLTAEFCLGWRL